jgi:hypothetical protein
VAIVVNHRLGQFRFPDNYTEAQINNKIIEAEAEYGEQYGIGETLYRAAERGLTGTARGLEQSATGEIEPGLNLFGSEDLTDLEKERELRIMLEQNPVAGYSALLLGSLADPVTLPFAFTKLIKSANIVKQGLSRGAAGGAVGGVLEPTYEEFGDSTVLNVMAGTGLGAGLGAAAGKIIQRVSEGPTVKVEGDEDGVVIPQQIREDGKLRDEVFQTIEGAELASIEARVGQRLQETGAIEDVQKLAEQLPTQQLAEPASPIARVFNPVVKLKEELIPVAAKALPRKEVQTLQRSLESVNQQLAKAQQIAGARKTVAAKARAEETVAKVQATQQKIASKLAEAQEAARAQRYINTIDSGRVDRLPAAQKARLSELQQESGADLNAVSLAAREQAQRLPEPIEAELSVLNAKLNDRLAIPERKPVAPRVPLGLDPLAGVGSTGTRPGGRFEATSPDAPGTEAVRRAFTGRTVPEQERFSVQQTEEGIVKTPTQIAGETAAEQNFHSRLQAESSEQLARLRDETIRGRYTWSNVTEGAVAVENRILEDYDDLATWLAENEQNILKADELEAITPLIQEAQQRMFDSRKILNTLMREGKLDSEEGLRVMQDIQYYNYIGNAGYIAQKTKISNAMTQLRRMRQFITLQEGQLERGETINQLMFGVKC